MLNKNSKIYKKELNCPLVKGIPVYVDFDTLPKHLQVQVKYFEKESRAKERYILEPWQKSYVDRFISVFGKDFSGKTVLDSGSGSGYMAIELAKLGAYVVATDLTLKYLVDLKHKVKQLGLTSNVELVCATSEDLPFKQNSFDYSISNAVLEHLPKEAEAISELMRVTKSCGGIMVAVPIKYRYINPLLLPINIIHDKRIGHLRRYNEKALIKKFRGCSILRTYYTGHTRKVLKTLINHFFPQKYDASKIEIDDKNTESKVYGSSNIITFMKNCEEAN